MKRIRVAKILMTFVLLGGSLLSFVLDWSPNHLLNPLWHPHARFHGALLLFLVAGVSMTGTWLLWRRSKEPKVAFQVAAASRSPTGHRCSIFRLCCRLRRGGQEGRERSRASMG